MFIFSVVDYAIHAHTEAVRYIFISKICFCVIMAQITDLCCGVKINNDIFVSLWYFLESDVSTNYPYCRCLSFLQDLKVSYQRKGRICYCSQITEFISRI